MNIKDDQLYILGEPVRINRVVDKVSAVIVDGKDVWFHMCDIENEEEFVMLLRSWLNKLSLEILPPIFDEVYEEYKMWIKKKPKLKLFWDNTLWSRCNSTRGRLYLSKELIMFPEECIKMRVIYEFCNYLTDNHNDKVYSVLEHFCPEWERIYSVFLEYEEKLPVVFGNSKGNKQMSSDE